MDVLGVLLLVIGLAVFGLTAMTFGADSRDGFGIYGNPNHPRPTTWW